ncbi:MAG: WG repeat-containing protein [Bacteroidetes bacterium]|nr:WG repeat-containing protein [Bacteroidota bacterium]
MKTTGKQSFCTFLGALIAVVLTFAASPSYSQGPIHLAEGKKLPNSAAENDWFLNTKDQRIFRYTNAKWSMFRVARCTRTAICHKFLLLHFEDGSMELVKANGKSAKPNYQARFQFQCYDSISTMEVGDNFILFDHQGRTLAEIDMRMCKGQKIIEFQGKIAFCVPEFVNSFESGPIPCSELKNWGMMDTDGKWRIEPKFDAFFQFINGTADVLYYGQRKKINESGEFVD